MHTHFTNWQQPMKKTFIEVISTIAKLEEHIAHIEDIKGHALYKSTLSINEQKEINKKLSNKKNKLLDIMKKAALSDCTLDI